MLAQADLEGGADFISGGETAYLSSIREAPPSESDDRDRETIARDDTPRMISVVYADEEEEDKEDRETIARDDDEGMQIVRDREDRRTSARESTETRDWPDHTTVARERERESEPTRTPRHIFLSQVRPPGPDGIGGRPLGDTLLQAVIRSRCRCQLIVWETDDDASEPDVDPTVGQNKIPEEFKHLKEIEVERGDDASPPHGRLTLHNPNLDEEDERATLTTGKWVIEALDEDGDATDHFEFSEIDEVGGEPESWKSRLEGKQTSCDHTAYFRFRVKDSAPPGEYTIRATWPSEVPDVTCEVSVKVTAPECTCEDGIEAMEPGSEESGTVEGYLESRDGDLGVCISGGGACAYPETVMLELSTFGVSEKEPTLHISARFADDAISSKLTALELKQIDPKADAEGVRERAQPDGRIPGKWKDSGWQRRALTVREPCESRPPLRVMVRLNTDPKVLRAVGSALHEKVRQAVEDGDANAYGDAAVNTVVRVRKDNSTGPVLCEYMVPIKVRGGIWVKNTVDVANNFAAEIMTALRAICGRGENDSNDFNWLEGRRPKDGAMGMIVPKPGFCDGSVDVPGHPRGRELVRRLLCGTCCAVIMTGNGDNYTPYIARDSFPKGLHPFGNVPHWADEGRDCSDRPTPAPRKVGKKGGELNGIKGTGIGTGGVAKVNIGKLTGGTKWRLWQPLGRDRWGDSSKVQVSGARVLAHELAHLALGCEGKLRSGIKVPLGKVDELNRELDKESARRLRKRLRAEFNTTRVTGTFDGRKYDVPLEGFDDLGEYDAIMEWENYIAAELTERRVLPPTSGMRSTYPRFSH